MNKLKHVVIVASLLAGPTAFAQQYHNLLGSRNMDEWMRQNGDAVDGGWVMEDGGVLHLSGKGGNIVTREIYGDFELWFDFRISPRGNNGIKYRVKQYGKSWLGIEYQILDDAAFPKLTRDHLTGSLYDLKTPIPSTTRLASGDEFNTGKIRVQNQRVQHWVNGQLLIDERLAGPSWQALVANSKFSNRENFGSNATGRIMLTDHGGEVWFRNIFIRRLDTCCR